MSLESTGVNPQRLLPTTVEDRLVGYLATAAGAVLLLAAALGWAALLTWTSTDPSLSHTGSGAARNILGGSGATFADLLVQTLGFGAVFTLMAPLVWGLELFTRQAVPDMKVKALLLPVSVLALAGGCSALPTPGGWPLHHGMGGILGDVMYSLATNILSMATGDRAGVLAGLCFFGGGFAALAHSVGMSLEDVSTALRPDQRIEPSLAPATSMIDTSRGWLPDLKAAFSRAPSREVGPARHVSGAAPVYAAPAPQPVADPAAPPAGVRPEGFEASTDALSRSIAERFAPPSSEPRLALPAEPARAPDTQRRGFLDVFQRPRSGPAYKRPSLNLLKRPPSSKLAPEFTQSVLRGHARLLEDVLADFGVKGEIKDIRPGPVVTLYELEPARGTKTSRVIGLSDDIARSMSASAVRVAVVPGRNAIGIELPNVRRETVHLREIMDSDAYKSADSALPLALGKSIGGEPVVADLARMPHLLVAGTTGSGKSVGINAMILSLLYRHSPDDCRLIMIDPKMLELSVYNGIPHLLTPVITDPERAAAALEWAVREMEERYKKMAQLGVRSIDLFNNRVRNARKAGEPLVRTVQTGFDAATGRPIIEREELGLEPFPYIVIVIDELADLMIVAGKEIEASAQRLAQMARAAGIHLVMATQRPSVDILTGTIKANFPSRISFRVASKIDSRTILNEQGAEQLLGHGDMLMSLASGQLQRVHGAYVTDDEVVEIANALREQGEPRYVEGITEPPAVREVQGPGAEPSADDLYDRAVAIVVRDRKASTSYLQRRLGIGYNRAADIVERMEKDGVIGPANHAGKRDILIGSDDDN